MLVDLYNQKSLLGLSNTMTPTELEFETSSGITRSQAFATVPSQRTVVVLTSFVLEWWKVLQNVRDHFNFLFLFSEPF